MPTIGELAVNINARTGPFSKAMDKARQKTQQFSKSVVGSANGALSRLSGALSSTAARLGALAGVGGLGLATVNSLKLAAAAAADEGNKTFSLEELMAKGEGVYKTSCAACHQANGEGLPGAFPALKGSAIATGDLAGHVDIVLNGKAGTAMAAFGGQLNDADLAAVITYERNAWGNDTGDVVQPADVKAAR